MLCQIEPRRDNLRHDRSPLWIITDPPWHTHAVEGQLHHQSHLTLSVFERFVHGVDVEQPFV